jgi:hypothetical protein
MGKIFEFIPGSLIERVNQKVGTNTNTVFQRTEKGVAAEFKYSVNSIIDYDDLGDIYTSGDFSINIVMKVVDQPDTARKIFSCISAGVAQWIEIGVSLLDAPRYVLFVVNSGEGQVYQYIDEADIPKNEFALYTFTKSSSGLNCYVNGVLKNTGQSGGDISDFSTVSLTHYSIGSRYGESIRHANGYIGKTQVYDHALTPEERALLYRDFLHASPITKTIR